MNTTAQTARLEAIEDAELIRLSLADQRCFAEALCSPPPANAALKRAFEKAAHKKRIYTRGNFYASD